ncbi:MAG: phosphatase PAP2 family protein [Acidimicrobiales bacterium]
MTAAGALGRRLDPDERFGLRLTLLAVAVLVVAVPFGWLLSQIDGHGALVRADASAATALHGWVRRTPGAVAVLKGVTTLGSPVLFYVVVGPAALFVWRRHHPRLAVFLVATCLGGGILDTAVKWAVDRHRPVFADPVATASGGSFPSGHAMSSVVVYGALLLVFVPVVARRWRPAVVAATVTLLLAIGFSRLALGVHYTTDVVGGWLLGLAWLAASTAAFRTWRVERGRPPVAAADGLEPEAAADLGRPAD